MENSADIPEPQISIFSNEISKFSYFSLFSFNGKILPY